MKTSTKTLNAKIDQSRRQVQYMEQNRVIDDFIEACAKYSSKRPNKGPESLSKPLNRQEAHNSPPKTKGYFEELSFERLKTIIEQREEIAKLKAEIKEANEHIETLANKLLNSK